MLAGSSIEDGAVRLVDLVWESDLIAAHQGTRCCRNLIRSKEQSGILLPDPCCIAWR